MTLAERQRERGQSEHARGGDGVPAAQSMAACGQGLQGNTGLGGN